MALKFTGRRFHDDQTGTVTFPAWNGEKRVNCRITDESLMFMFGAERTDSGLLEAFDKNRPLIEAAAGWKFEELAGGMNITLASRDFPDKKPAAPDVISGPQRMPEPVRDEQEKPSASANADRVAAQAAADRVQKFRQQAQAVQSARSVSADVAAWNAETAKVIGKLDADKLVQEEPAPAGEPEKRS